VHGKGVADKDFANEAARREYALSEFKKLPPARWVLIDSATGLVRLAQLLIDTSPWELVENRVSGILQLLEVTGATQLPVVYLVYGECLVKAGRYEEGLTYYYKAQDKAYQNPEAADDGRWDEILLRKKAEVFGKLNEMEKAADCQRKALRLYMNHLDKYETYKLGKGTHDNGYVKAAAGKEISYEAYLIDKYERSGELIEKKAFDAAFLTAEYGIMEMDENTYRHYHNDKMREAEEEAAKEEKEVLSIIDEKGVKKEVEVVAFFTLKSNGRDYLVYTENITRYDVDEYFPKKEVYVSEVVYGPEDTVVFEGVGDDVWEEVQQVMLDIAMDRE
jgi:tetratricopeptide (TPR) repeat protein